MGSFCIATYSISRHARRLQQEYQDTGRNGMRGKVSARMVGAMLLLTLAPWQQQFKNVLQSQLCFHRSTHSS
eukprot:3941610-Rhodomonas_salina.1